MTQATPALPSTHLRCGFYSRAGRACALYLQNGGRLQDIQMQPSQLLENPIQITPPPTGPRDPYPNREQVEADLLAMWINWQVTQNTRMPQALRFLFAFCHEMDRQNEGWSNWARVWVHQLQAHHQQELRYRYTDLLGRSNKSPNGYAAYWEPHPSIDPQVLNAMLTEACNLCEQALSHSRRAVVVKAEILGQPVVIKRYAPNPKAWKQRWEISRARRAWAGASLLAEQKISAIRGLGWLEHYQDGNLQESYFISAELPPMETLRVWLRREYPRMNADERILFRHHLRHQIQNLQHHGLCHSDLKLSNLLVQGAECKDLKFYWIDLEDIKPGQSSKRTFVRNLYQLNGSLPREITDDERRAFLAGFQRIYPFATSSQLFRYVRRKTQKRLQDEINRTQGA